MAGERHAMCESAFTITGKDVLFVSVDHHVSLRGQHRPKDERAIRKVYPPFYSELHSSYNPTNTNLT